MKEIFGILGVAFMLGSGIPYAVAIWQKTVKPHAFSWLLWGIINAVVLAAQIAKGAESGAWPTAVSACITFSIGFYALKWGERQYTRSDWFFLLCALSAIPLWIVTDDPLWSVILVCVIDLLAFFPTIRKSWMKPQEESAASFVAGAIGFFFSFLAVETYVFTNYGYPLLVTTANILFVTMLLVRRRKQKNG